MLLIHNYIDKHSLLVKRSINPNITYLVDVQLTLRDSKAEDSIQIDTLVVSFIKVEDSV